MKRIIYRLRSYENLRILFKNIRWRFLPAISSQEHIFIIGCPRSGTTLLQRVLAVHSQLFSISKETGLFTYQNIFNSDRKHFDLDKETISHLLHVSKDIVDFFDRAVDTIAPSSNLRFVEKTPQHIFRLNFLLKHFPNSYFIHIVRDGRDCYCSAKSVLKMPHKESISDFAKYWKRSVNIPAVINMNESILTVSYEDLTKDTHKTLSRIMNFLNLEVEDVQFNHINIGNDPRSQATHFLQLNNPINTNSINRWERELEPGDILEFEKIASDQLKYYGYKLIN